MGLGVGFYAAFVYAVTYIKEIDKLEVVRYERKRTLGRLYKARIVCEEIRLPDSSGATDGLQSNIP